MGYKRKTYDRAPKERAPREVEREYIPGRLGKRGLALVFGYSGAGYNGLQIQPGQDQTHVKTIESDILEALYKGKLLSRGESLYDVFWSRAGRTDKGVHAAMNVLGGRLHVFDVELAEIREKHAKETANVGEENEAEVSAETETVPPAKRANQAVGSNGAVRIEGEFENRIADVMGSGEAYKDVDINRYVEFMKENDILYDELDIKGLKVVEGRLLDVKRRINEHLPPQIRLLAVFRTNKNFDARSACDSREYEYLLPVNVLNQSENAKALAGVVDGDDEATINEKLRVLLDAELKKSYLNTHNFHNFTLGVSHDKQEAKRFIKSIGCSAVVCSNSLLSTTLNEIATDENVSATFFKIDLHGQSFLLHQIRKMIGALVGQLIAALPENVVSDCLTSTAKMNTPLAPAEGLFLASTHFEAYSESKAQPPITFPLDMTIPSLIEDSIKVRRELIYPEISRHAIEGVWDTWIAGKDNWKAYMFNEKNQNELEIEGMSKSEDAEQKPSEE